MTEEKEKRETLDSELLVALKERFKSPIWGTFILVFFVYNWDVFSIYVFEEETRLSIEHAIQEKTKWAFFGIPAAIVLLYLACYDLIQGLVNLYRENIGLKVSEWSQSTKSAQSKIAVIETKYIQIARESDEYIEIEKKLLELEKQNEKRKAEFEEADRLRAELEESHANEAIKVEDIQKEIESAGRLQKELEEKHASQNIGINEIQKEIESLNDKKIRVDKEINSLKGEFSSRVKERESLSNELEKIKAELSQMASESQSIEDSKDNVRADYTFIEGDNELRRIFPEYKPLREQPLRLLSNLEKEAVELASAIRKYLENYVGEVLSAGGANLSVKVGFDRHMRLVEDEPFYFAESLFRTSQVPKISIGLHAHRTRSLDRMFHLVFFLAVDKDGIHLASAIYGTTKFSSNYANLRKIDKNVRIESGIEQSYRHHWEVDTLIKHLSSDLMEELSDGGDSVVGGLLKRYVDRIEGGDVTGWLSLAK